MKIPIKFLLTTCLYILLGGCMREPDKVEVGTSYPNQVPQPSAPIKISPKEENPTETSHPSKEIFTFEELDAVIVSVETNLIASPSHPNSFLPSDYIRSGELAHVVGGDEDSAWLLVLHDNIIGWIPSLYSKEGIATLNTTLIEESNLDTSTNYLGALIAPDKSWKSNSNGRTIVQGYMYLRPGEKFPEENFLKSQIIETGKVYIPQFDYVEMDAGGKILIFTFIIEDFQEGDHIQFDLSDLGSRDLPFQAAFFCYDCDSLTEGLGVPTTKVQLDTPSPMATIIIHIQSTPSPDSRNQAIISNRITLEQFVSSYFKAINNRNYQKTWGMLSDHFKRRQHCCNSDGSYQKKPYIQWWKSVQKVKILNIDTLRLENNFAVVSAKLKFYFMDGRVVDDTINWELIPNSSGDSWLFY